MVGAVSKTLAEMQKHIWFIARGVWRSSPFVLAFAAASACGLFWPTLTGIAIGVGLVCIALWMIGRQP
jgi:hypothetical protein